ncbi:MULTISPECIES: hypothetical protein [Burkholderia]|uniref:Uncharacterized protein n=1 Tax=Burkholderia anthinoferrum TaxID=3090833 RepID=A0ABU5WXN7_9BURK|nr:MULTISPECIES: hypothetical protein [Burkholderia]MEB2507328.1 hypothetical protein [Burkholderia anthinoferrum]MEB2535961.1 hypothetical protein [Burkholderia anthinoferrum]MEB2565161.1 hypothetical protein [Burkholderia anthinoferrum]MEB2583158.1 hypothetical protein [Burkholderia anthinoferrum]MBR8348681.1 hypothetical protein [Burkholderia ambifaria]
MMSYPQFTEFAEWQIRDYCALSNPVYGNAAVAPDVAKSIARGAFNLWREVALQGFAAAERPTYEADVVRLAAAVDASFPDKS